MRTAGSLIHINPVQSQAEAARGFEDNMVLTPLLGRLAKDNDPMLADAIASSDPALATIMFHTFLENRDLNPGLLTKLATVAGATAKGSELQNSLAGLGEHPDAKLIRAFAIGLRRAGTTIAKVDTEKKLSAVFTKAADTAGD